jgi:hypothetical protein
MIRLGKRRRVGDSAGAAEVCGNRAKMRGQTGAHPRAAATTPPPKSMTAPTTSQTIAGARR